MRRSRGWTSVVGLITLVCLMAGPTWALKVGDKVSSVQVRDSNDKAANIPDIGKKILTVFYTDPDAKDDNEPFRDLLKEAKLDESKYRGMGVVNMKDTWSPNWAIRKVVRDKIEKFKSLILTDPEYILKNRWKLGDCNDKDLVIVIGLDKKVKYFSAKKMSAAEQKKALQLVQDLISGKAK